MDTAAGVSECTQTVVAFTGILPVYFNLNKDEKTEKSQQTAKQKK